MANSVIDKLLEGDYPGGQPTPDWLKKPASIKPISSVDDFTARADSFFTQCTVTEIRPTLTGFCLAVGLPGPTSLIRLGQRIPELRYKISSCMTAISYGYESMLGYGASSGALFMLKNIPDFDPDDPEGSPGVQFFNDRKEIILQTEVHGAVSTEEETDLEIDPVEAYLSLIKKPVGQSVKASAAPLVPRPIDNKLKSRPLMTILRVSKDD